MRMCTCMYIIYYVIVCIVDTAALRVYRSIAFSGNVANAFTMPWIPSSLYRPSTPRAVINERVYIGISIFFFFFFFFFYFLQVNINSKRTERSRSTSIHYSFNSIARKSNVYINIDH